MSLADDLQQEQVRSKRATEMQVELDAQRNRFIAAELPIFWKLLGELVQAEVLKLKGTAYECDVSSKDSSLTIRRSAPPFRNIRITLSIDGHTLHVAEAEELDSMGTPQAPINREDIRVGVQNDALAFRVGGRMLRTPDELSDRFLGFVCQ